MSLPSNGRIELDSHADTVVLSSNCVVVHHMGKVCEVSPYMDEYDAITDVPVSEVPLCGRTSILTMNTSSYSMRLYGWVIPSLIH